MNFPKEEKTHALPTPLYILTLSSTGIVSSCLVVNSRIRFSRDLLAICPLTWFRLRWDTTAWLVKILLDSHSDEVEGDKVIFSPAAGSVEGSTLQKDRSAPTFALLAKIVVY